MILSLNWIKEFVDLEELDTKELVDRFTLGVAEVEDYKISNDFKGIVVAKILEINKHPKADKLNLVKVDIGNQIVEVVCGANNVKKDLMVPYAPVGTTLPNGLVLESRSIRGVVSSGMLCSAEELAISSHSDGLYEIIEDKYNLLEKKIKPGDPLNSLIPKDIVIDIDNKSLTHRPDLWGIYGLAREFAAVFKCKLKNSFDDLEKLEANFTKDSPIKVAKEGESALLGYLGLSVENVKIEPSPIWMQERLIASGINPINNMVDIGNYVMVELGIPLHIFDRKQIKGSKIVLKQLGHKEKFVALDNKEYELIETDTVVSDTTRPLVIAGIMGGLNSGVEDNTTEIFIETANWDPYSVRKTSLRLGLRSESSMRYEKSLDSSLLKRSLLRAYSLVKELCPNSFAIGIVESTGMIYPKPKDITTSFSNIEKLLGIKVPNAVDLLNSLDFETKVEGDIIKVNVPSYRATKDIEVEADIIEEIGRLVGYDNIKEEAPLVPSVPVELYPIHKTIRKIEDFLVLKGNALEIKLISLTGDDHFKKMNLPKSDVLVMNPISSEHQYLRNSLLPGFLSVINHNQKYFEKFRFFEIGKTYQKKGDEFSEKYMLLLAIYEEENAFNEITSLAVSLLQYLGVKYQLLPSSSDWEGVNPKEMLKIRVMGKDYGEVFSLHPYMIHKLKLKGPLHFFSLDLTPFNAELKDKHKFKELSKFPVSKFDFTVVVPLDFAVGNLIDRIKGFKIKEVMDVLIKDLYLREKDKTVTVRTILGKDGTLDSETLTNLQHQIVKNLEQTGISLKE